MPIARTMNASCEISTGRIKILSNTPLFSSENRGDLLVATLYKNGTEYYLDDSVTPYLQMFYPLSRSTSEQIEMEVGESSNTIFCYIPKAMLEKEDRPVMVLLLKVFGGSRQIVLGTVELKITKTS